MSSELATRLLTPLPRRMRTLERDRRGYPIPFVVVRDKTGEPQFTINDHEKVLACVNKKLCALCGKRCDDGFWFVGGSRCFTHSHGAFLDPPSHQDCAEFALRFCPFLAAPSYGRRIELRKLAPEALPDDMVIAIDESMKVERPDRFGLGKARGYDYFGSIPVDRIFVVSQWRFVEYWRHGQPAGAPARNETA